MKKAAIFGGALAVVAIAAVVSYFLTVSPRKQTHTHPSDMSTQWVCIAQDEPHDFLITVRDLAKAGGVTCPVCGSDEVFRALPCPKCGKFYPIGQYNASPTNCMYCGEELPGKDVSTFHSHEGH